LGVNIQTLTEEELGEGFALRRESWGVIVVGWDPSWLVCWRGQRGCDSVTL
jgi:hypothetical protein